MMYKSVKGAFPDFSLIKFHLWLLLLLTISFILARETVFCKGVGLNDLDVDIPLVLTELDLQPQSVSVMTHISFWRVLKLGNFLHLPVTSHIWLASVPRRAKFSKPHAELHPCVFGEVVSGCSSVLLYSSD